MIPGSRYYSNLDYGQNRERVQRYVRESGVSAVTDQAVVTPGLYVVGANALTKFGNFKSHRWLIDRDIPAVNFGFTDFGFVITGDRFEQYMNEARVAPDLSGFDSLCSGDLRHYAPGSQIPFVRTDPPQADQTWVICVTSRKGVDVGMRVDDGRLFFGRMVDGDTCVTDLLQVNQAAWFRVARGARAQLCIREIPYRRTHLPYRMSASVIVRGQGADVDIRLVPAGRIKAPYGQESVR